MMFELLLAGFIMAVGLAIAGTGTYFYQWVIGQQAMLRYDGKTFVHIARPSAHELHLRPVHHAADGLEAGRRRHAVDRLGAGQRARRLRLELHHRAVASWGSTLAITGL